MPDVTGPVLLHCHMCADPDDGLIVTTWSRHWRAAIEHALDNHRVQLLTNPKKAIASITVTDDAEPTLLQPPERLT